MVCDRWALICVAQRGYVEMFDTLLADDSVVEQATYQHNRALSEAQKRVFTDNFALMRAVRRTYSEMVHTLWADHFLAVVIDQKNSTLFEEQKQFRKESCYQDDSTSFETQKSEDRYQVIVDKLKKIPAVQALAQKQENS